MKKEATVLYEDNHLILVSKPGGWLVQGDETGDETLGDYIKHYIKVKYHKPGDVFLGVIHRLDRPVSGVVAFARTSKALERMNALFRDRKVIKTYWALTKKRPPQTQEELVHWLKKDHTANRTSAFNKAGKGAQQAILSYKLIGRIAEYYLLEVTPMTGRPHQIRVQLAKVGCPILGDVKYGGQQTDHHGHIYLHSRALSFVHPVKKEEMTVKAGLPNDPIWSLFHHY